MFETENDMEQEIAAQLIQQIIEFESSTQAVLTEEVLIKIP